MREGAAAELRIAEIVLTAAELEGHARESYLHDLAVTEGDLVAAARRRLALAEELPDSFLVAPAAVRLGGADREEEEASAAALPPEERYELGECLGEGGMGRVMKAFDRQLGRTVALKLLTHGAPEIRRLFLAEARAQARVEHDHVLEVYDSGELEGQPFLAMHYVAGGTLAEIGDTLPLEGRVRLLCQAAEGLHAAHRQGLLHRDVKPSNILVERTDDGDLRAQVTDFGLATELEGAEDSAEEGVAGSPQYIAPERLGVDERAAIDRRSDVYSLGVTLYRVLTGALPFSGQNTLEVLRQAVLHDLPPPRQRLPELPVELEAIILRCIAREPEERYASARAVARDLQRYLDGEVVEAYTAGLAYRITRFVLRHRVLVGLVAVTVLALAVSSVAVAIFALRADEARHRAEARQGQAEDLIDFMVFDLRAKLETLGRLDVLTDVGQAATEYFAAVPEAELSEKELLRRSRMLYQIGEVRIRQGDLEGAAAPLGESLVLARRLAELDPRNGQRLFELGQAYFWVGYVGWEQGDLASARGPFEKYLEVSRQLVAMDPTHRDWRRELSYAHSNLGSLRQAEGDLEGALEQFFATLTIDRELVAVDPTSEARSELAATHNTVGVVLQDLGRLQEAREHLVADLEIRRALVAEEPDQPALREHLGTSLSHLGGHLFMQGDLASARQHLEAMRQLAVELVEYDPTNTVWRYQLAWSELDLARVAIAERDLGAADGFLQSAIQVLDELLRLDGERPKWRRSRAIASHHVALLKHLRGDPGAREMALAASESLSRLAEDQPMDRSAHRWLAHSFLLVGTLEEAEVDRRAAWERAVATLEPFALGGKDGRLLAPWAVALACLGRRAEAQPVVERLNQAGYSEPGLAELCWTSPAEVWPAMSGMLRILR